MAKADTVLSLARAALDGDRDRVISMCRIIAANERPTSSLKSSIERLLSRPGTNGVMIGDTLPAELKGLALQMAPTLSLEDVVLPNSISCDIEQFLAERVHAGAIHDAGLPVPHRILLSGPPGNGKTTLAGAIADVLELPFLVVDFSNVISSHLGETGGKLAKLFRGLVDMPAVLFVDEMETVLSERANAHGIGSDVGEIARVVSSLLLEIDRLPDHVILIGATNHSELLDRAVVRRFEYRWDLPEPDDIMIQTWLNRFAIRYPTFPTQENANTLIEMCQGLSLSDTERKVMSWCRQWIVEQLRQTDKSEISGKVISTLRASQIALN